MQYKLVCSDIDGTLLNKDRVLSKRTIKAIESIKDILPVILVSSRMPKAMRHLQKDLDIMKEPLIAYNGALIIDYNNGLERVLFSEEISAGLFGHGNIPDAMLGAAIGSIAAGHPLASYLLGGELLSGGVGLIAVTAMLVTWVTVGIVQLPAEALMLGTRFAVYRNIISFGIAIIIALLTVYTLQLLGMA